MSIKRVLVVDDQADIRILLKRCLERQRPNYQVATAVDGSAALDQLQQQPFDLVVTDWQMPGMNGLDLAQAARLLWPEMRIVLMTGHYTPELGCAIEQVKLDGYLDKPFTPGQFLAMVAYVE